MRQKAKKNILVIRNDRFGEFILTIPAMQALKKAYPGSRLSVVVNTHVKDLAGCVAGIDEVLCWEPVAHTFREIIAYSKVLRQKRYDISVVFNPTRDAHLATFFAGIPVRVGYSRKCPFFLTRTRKDDRSRGLKHEVEYNLELVRCLGMGVSYAKPTLTVDTACLKGFSFDWGGGLPPIALHPYTSDPIKQWPLDCFFSLARKIARALGAKVIVIGGKEERRRSMLFSDTDNPKIIDFVGTTSLSQLAAILSKCKLLISGDSGPVHLATCVNTPSIVLFRNDMPGKGPTRWGPLSPGSIVIDKPDIADISVQEVFDKVALLWGK